jgi:hypothetical protein
MAPDLVPLHVPEVALCLAQLPAPHPRVAPEHSAHVLLRGGAAIPGDNVIPECLTKSALERHLIAPATAGGMEEYFHKL